MYTRPRKLASNQNDFEALEKQLNNDFEVHTYLEKHQLDLNNAQSYAQILNYLVLERRTRSKQLLKLKTFKAMQPQTQDNLYRQEFQAIEERTGKEEEITKNLDRQITETKKSLNLLKGDIGFLVSRNQSAQLLGSKVTKVKIVAEDQLKRVSMAYSKDREEIKIRNQMQKKFGKKLKNISNYETSSLSRSKQFFIDSQIIKNEVYNKLFWSQQAAQNSEEIAAIQKQKQIINLQNRMQQLTILQLSSVIKHFSHKEFQTKENVSNLYAEIQDFLGKLQLPDEPDQSLINEEVDNILKEYQNIKDNIKTNTEFYNEQLQIKQELSVKMKECQHEQCELLKKFELEALFGYKISQNKLKDYNQKLKKFASIIKTYFVLLTYLKKYQKRQQINQSEKRRHSSFCGQKSIKYSIYITQLHKTHQILSSDQLSEFHRFEHERHQEIYNFYQNMSKDVYDWILTLKNRITQGLYNPVQRSAYDKQTMYSQTSQFALPIQIVYKEYSSAQENKTQSEVIQVKAANKAQRIQLLEDVDRDYYKMIKATMKMEKENTRKNYQFQRVFKRAKYASRDDILQQKRFQASFSVLFTKESAMTRTFGLQSRSSSEYPLSKTIHTFHTSAKSSFKPNKPNLDEPKKQIKMPTKKFLCEERQKKSRLTQKMREALCYRAI